MPLGKGLRINKGNRRTTLCKQNQLNISVVHKSRQTGATKLSSPHVNPTNNAAASHLLNMTIVNELDLADLF